MQGYKNRISDNAVKNATGKSWEEWTEFLDENNAQEMMHKEIVSLLNKEGGIKSGWWCQTVAVGYEHKKGLRKTGQTASAGFEIGVQKTINASPKEVWEALLSAEGLKLWLGNISKLELKEKEKYKTKDGTEGEIRTFDEGTKLRLTWYPDFLKRPSTVQIYLEGKKNNPNKTAVRFHQEKLSNKKERTEMRKYWHKALEELEKLF